MEAQARQRHQEAVRGVMLLTRSAVRSVMLLTRGPTDHPRQLEVARDVMSLAQLLRHQIRPCQWSIIQQRHQRAYTTETLVMDHMGFRTSLRGMP